jgi:prepilin-type N-terminal cleavage/methylation domain-containing protein
MLRKKGFTMVELLVVLIILAILVAVAAPMYFANADRARASEAVAGMGTIRSALRDYHLAGGAYFDIASPNIENALPPATNPGVNARIGVTQYFSKGAYSVDGTAPASARFTNPGPQDFIISVNGSTAGGNVACTTGSTADCAVKGGDVANFLLEMDNSGRAFVSYNGGTNYSAY